MVRVSTSFTMKISLTFFVCSALVFEFSEGNALTAFKAPSPCGEWTPYKDEKCVKIAQNAGHQTQKDAEIVCEAFSEELHRESYPKLITVKTKEEQDFLYKFLFVDNKLKDHVWLGLREVGESGEFEWNDGTKPYFTNWANQTVTDKEHHCVQMESGGGMAPAGSWVRVACEKSTTVVCERAQTLTLEILQNLFFNYKLEQIQELKKRDEEIKQLKENPVPIGFIYTQLPDQPPPTSLWPNINWTDISSKYSGLFFRVVGGNAAPFGQVQEGNTTRLEQVEYNTDVSNSKLITIPPDGSWSVHTYSGSISGSNIYLRFRLSTEEVRPRNQAIKLWQRNK